MTTTKHIYNKSTEKKTKKIQALLQPSLYIFLTEEAQKNHTSVNGMLNDVIQWYKNAYAFVVKETQAKYKTKTEETLPPTAEK